MFGMYITLRVLTLENFMQYVWVGCSSLADKLYNKWVNIFSSFQPIVVLDNNPEKVGTTFHNIPVDSVSNIRNYLSAQSVVIITSSYIDEIRVQLKDIDVPLLDYHQINSQLNDRILSCNAELRDVRRSERCFIIGNGPSLSDIDLGRLHGSDCIIVNHAYKSEKLLNLEPLYWVIADPLFWKKSDDYLSPIFDAMLAQLPKTCLFMHRAALYFLSKEKALHEKVRFYDMSSIAEDDFPLIHADFAQPMQNYAQNVLCPSILLAMYLGYKEIYLLGFDHSWWAYTEEDITEGRSIPHVYKNSVVDERIAKECFRDLGYEGLRKTIDRQRLEYKAIRYYAEYQNIHIYNASLGGELDCFKRIDFNFLTETDDDI
jgi:hypothetical protein